MIKAELNQNIRKVKKFLKERDYSKIDIGIELIRSLNEPNIFKELLGRMSYNYKRCCEANRFALH